MLLLPALHFLKGIEGNRGDEPRRTAIADLLYAHDTWRLSACLALLTRRGEQARSFQLG